MSTTLYPGIPFSPQATLTNNIGAADTIIQVSDVSAFPNAPNLATIGTDEEGETILYTAKTNNALSGCQRGVEGTAKAWAAGELIGRNFTAKDHNDLIALLQGLLKDLNGKQPTLTGLPGQVVGFNAVGKAEAQTLDGVKLLTATIPKGRMRGDVDGDGRITQADVDMISKYAVGSITLTDVDAWCADINEDGSIDVSDGTTASQYIGGLRNSLPNWLDYYGNWIYVDVEGQEGCWKTNIAVPTLTSGMSATIIVQEVWEPGMFSKAEVANGVIRLSSIHPPITDVPCAIIYGKGSGLATIYVQHFLTTEQIGAVKKPIIAEVKLHPKRWDEDNCQYVDVKGALGTTWINQTIQVIPSPGSGDKYKSCGISHEPDTEYDDSIRFHAVTIPTNVLSVRVIITDIS